MLKQVFILFILSVISFFVRTYQIDVITPGMYGDEITVATESLQLLNSHQLTPFLTNYFHPTPLLYLTAIIIKLLGHTIFSIRLPSILFGVITIVPFFLLLRQFFSLRIATFGSLLLVFQYEHIVVSRLAYETAPSLFFQTLCLTLFLIYYKTSEKLHLFFLAIALGLGLYTYLDFRIFTVIILFLTGYIVFKKEQYRVKVFVLFLVIYIFVVSPLVIFSLEHWHSFWGRVEEISLVSKNYSVMETVKELFSSILRTTLLPFLGIPYQNPPLIGDPNPAKNPAGMPMFDPITSILACVGGWFLFRRKKQLFGVFMIISLSPFLNDILSTETIPGEYYYGLGHPNALRFSGIIIVVLFFATAGLSYLINSFKNRRWLKNMPFICMVLACFINLFWYFNQASINRRFYDYNYQVNNAGIISMISYLNVIPLRTISVTKDLYTKKAYFDLLLNKNKKIKPFKIISSEEVKHTIEGNDVTAIEVNQKTVDLINTLTVDEELESHEYTVHAIQGLTDQPDIVLFLK